jgi:DNA polymerase I-like protein with 3'-5' exonuclease and polymerase domains
MSIERTILQSKVTAVDTETTGLLAWKGDQPFAISFWTLAGNELYYEWQVDPYTRTVMPDPVQLEFCAELLGNKNIVKVFLHAKFDIRMMEEAHSIITVPPIDEVMYMAHACNSLEARVALKYLQKKYLGMERPDEIALKKATVKARRIARKEGWNIAEDVEGDYWLPKTVDPSDHHCEDYCIRDSQGTMLLRQFYKEHAMADLDVEAIYAREMELWPIVYAMESRGVACNLDTVEREVKRNKEEIVKWGKVITTAAWPDIDLNSPADLGKLFYNKLRLPVKRWTSGGTKGTPKPQVNVDALEEFGEHPIGRAVSKYRAASKALTSFFGKFENLIRVDPLVRSGYALHPEIRQVGPATGRTAMANPNFQNTANALTTRSKEPIQARTPFGPRPGCIWIHYDYEGQEVRIFADVSGETALKKAIEGGYNAHEWTANKAWGGEDNERAIKAAVHALELDGTGSLAIRSQLQAVWDEFGIIKIKGLSQNNQYEIASKWMKSFGWNIVKAEASLNKKTCKARAKMLFFAKIYGGGPNAVSDLLKCSYDEAQEFLAIYDEIFPVIREYIAELSSEARTNGYIINRYGRRLTVNPDKPYKAVNYMVQGSAADQLKCSMIKLDKEISQWGLGWYLILPIHDETVFEVLREHAFRCCVEKVKEIMEDHEGHFNIKMPVEIEVVTTTWNIKEHLIYRKLKNDIVA